MKKILIVAPHGDDEVLGCGGYLLREKDKGAKIHILFGAVGGTDWRQNAAERMEEIANVCEQLGATFSVIKMNHDAVLDTVSSMEITTAIDKAIAEFEPDEFLFNSPSRHQDHVKLYNCALAALRLKEGFMPPMVALYEYPFTLAYYDVVPGGKMYVDITEQINDKVKLFELYKSQIKHSPSPLNADGIMTLARARGLECGKKYAEVFYIQTIFA